VRGAGVCSCCSVLQCVAVVLQWCCSVLQRCCSLVAVCCSVFCSVCCRVRCSVLQCVAPAQKRSACGLECVHVAVRCSMLQQYVAAYSSVLQCITVCVAVCVAVRVVVCCSVLHLREKRKCMRAGV